MQVILLERVEKLGQMGDVVSVRPGFARNYLLPQDKALRATESNIAIFETQKKQLEAKNLERRGEAEKVAKDLEKVEVIVIRQASEGGQLYGSVSTRDIADVITAAGVSIDRQQVKLDRSFKMLGLYPVKIELHAEVIVEVTMNIARSEEEAKIQKDQGEALITADEPETSLAEAAIEAVVAEEKEEEPAEDVAEGDADAAPEDEKQEAAAS